MYKLILKSHFLKGDETNISEISNKESFYTIDVSLPKKLIITYNKEIEFKQEMQGWQKLSQKTYD